MKSRPGTYRKRRETLPLRGGRERVGVERKSETPSLPLTLALSPKGRGEIIFDNMWKNQEVRYGNVESRSDIDLQTLEGSV